MLAVHGVADERLEALEERAFREAAALAAPSIVRIETVGGLDVVGSLLASSGPTTGVVVGDEGWIITSSFNFASKPASILVTTTDGRRHPAQVVAADDSRMLTLLKIEATGLSPLKPAPREDVAVGQWAIALGQTYAQPFPNVSVGIISAVGRIWGRAIQTDAKISPANYGGPLVDVRGRGVGILVPLSPTETEETAGVEWYDSGIGFAVPLEDVYAVLDRLKAGENLKPGLMGVGFADRSPISGATVIDRVRPGSPAGEAGLAVGDTIVEIDGQPVSRVPHLRHVLGRKYAGDVILLQVEREGKTIEATLTLAAELAAYERPSLGILPARVARSEEADGVEIRLVLPGSPAAAANLERGDRITAVDGEHVNEDKQLGDVIGHQHPGDVLNVTFDRNGASQEAQVTLAALGGELPESLPTVEIPRPGQDVAEKPATGRLVEILGDDEERTYWAYVPEGYNPEYSYGLVVWLHPPGDTMEGSVLKAWRSQCVRRGLILLSPKTSRPAGWTPADIDFVQDLVDEFRERYTIDPARIVIHAAPAAGQMAAVTAFRQRETFRGLSLINAPLRIPPPETDPDAPLSFHFAFNEDDPAITRGVEVLQQLKFPVTTHLLEDTDQAQPSAAAAEAVARWVDALDRI